MRILFLILFFSCAAFGQIVDSHSADKSGMYFYSFDSLMNLILEDKKMDRIHLRADHSICKEFPEEHLGIQILKMNNYKNIKKNKLKKGELVVDIGQIYVLKDELSIWMRVFERTKDSLTFYDYGLYIFVYTYNSGSETYKLVELSKGIDL